MYPTMLRRILDRGSVTRVDICGDSRSGALSSSTLKLLNTFETVGLETLVVDSDIAEKGGSTAFHELLQIHCFTLRSVRVGTVPTTASWGRLRQIAELEELTIGQGGLQWLVPKLSEIPTLYMAARGALPSLRRLNLRDGSLQLLPRYLQWQNCLKHLEHIDIRLHEDDSFNVQYIIDTLDAATGGKSDPSTTDATKTIKPKIELKHFLYISSVPPDEHSNPMQLLYRPVLFPLLACPGIVHIEITSPSIAFALSNDDLFAIAKSLPLIQTLILTSPMSSIYSELSLEGLVHVARWCPCLERLSLPVNEDTIHGVSGAILELGILDIRNNSILRELDVGIPMVDNIEVVGEFLVTLFPSLDVLAVPSLDRARVAKDVVRITAWESIAEWIKEDSRKTTRNLRTTWQRSREAAAAESMHVDSGDYRLFDLEGDYEGRYGVSDVGNV